MTIAQARGAPLNFSPRLFTTMFDESVDRYPERSAVDFMGRKYSFRTLSTLVERAAAGLQALGVEKGTRVALCLPNIIYYPVLFLATLRAGGIVVNVNPLYVEREMINLLEDSGARIVVTCDVPDIQARVMASATHVGLDHVILCPIADALPPLKSAAYRLFKRKEIAVRPRDARIVLFRDLAKAGRKPRPVECDPDDVAVFQYTGGTTGTPKAAMLSHANLVANADACALHFSLDPNKQESILGVLPLFHVFALTTVFGFGVRSGSEMILIPRFQLKLTVALLKKMKPTSMPAVPTIFNALAELASREKLDLSFVRACISGGAALPGEVRQAFERNTGGRLVEGYGLSEASPIITCNPIEGHSKDGSAGQPFPGTTIEIRDPASHTMMQTGEIGEICARGPQVMKGYWNRPDATNEVFVDGALRTGDLGYLDADGYLFIVDRMKDLILCSGYNVYPRTIEDAAYEHAAVAEAICIGVADRYRGESPKLFVTLKDGAQATGEDIREFLRDKLSKIELPREVEVRASLPKTLIGKLSKKELVEEERLKAAASSPDSDRSGG